MLPSSLATGVRTLLVACMVLIPLYQARDLSQLDAYASQIADQRLFAGMVHVDQGGSTVFSKGYGQAVYELDVPMGNDHIYPIGSNTKLFTAVAVWQLHKAGKLNVYEPVSKYMNGSELGLAGGGPWCPRAHNASTKGPCQTPQLQHLLRMSGGVLGFDDCEYPSDAWQQQYCLTGPLLGPGLGKSITSLLTAEAGALSMAEYLKLSGVLNMPLEFEPGRSYHYSNPGYTLAGYVVEKVSGMPIADYFRINIFNKADLSSTAYDVTNGILGLRKRQLPYPAYISYLRPGATDQIAATAGLDISQYVASSGSPAFWGGDVNAYNNNITGITIRDGVHYAMTARYPGPSNFDWNAANAAGAILSTPQDMAKWFRALLVDSEHLGLGKDTLKEMLGLSTVVPRMPTYKSGNGPNVTLLFSQGLLVVPVLDAKNDSRGLGVSHVYYLGSLGGFEAVTYMSLHAVDPSKDVFVNVVAATVLPAAVDWPETAQNLTGAPQCKLQLVNNINSASSGRRIGRRLLSQDSNSYNSSSSSSSSLLNTSGIKVAEMPVMPLLCQLRNNVPVVMTTVPDLLARKAVEGLTGALWFDIQT